MKSLTHASNLWQIGQGENLMGGQCWKIADDGYSQRGNTLMESAQEASDMWYNEIKYFNWSDYRSHSGVVGHFTQVKPVPYRLFSILDSWLYLIPATVSPTQTLKNLFSIRKL